MTLMRKHVPETIIAAAFFLTCACLFFTDLPRTPADLIDDADRYSALALSLVNHGAYALDGVTPFFEREPGYPMFLAGLYAAFGQHSVLHVYAVQALLHFVAVSLLCVMIGRIFSRRAALITFALLLLSPPILHMIFAVLRESLALSLALSLAAGLLRLRLKPSFPLAIFCGAVLGWLFLTYAVFLLFPFFLIALLLLWRMRPGIIAACVLSCVVVMIPWGARNHAHTGMTCMTGCYRAALQWHVRGEQAKNVRGFEPAKCLWAEYVSRDWSDRSPDCSFNAVWHRKWPDGFKGVPADAEIAREGQRAILENFPNYLWFSLFEIVELHIPYVNGWGTGYNVLTVLWAVLAYLGALAALPSMRRKEQLVFWAFLSYVTGLFILTDATPRYLVPVLFCYAVWAGIGYDGFLKRIWRA